MKPTSSLLTVALGSAFAFGLAVTFQNCGQGFQVTSELDSLAQLSASAPHGKIPQVLLENSAPLQDSTDLQFVVYSENLSSDARLSWSHTFNGLKNACIIKSSDQDRKYVLQCEEGGELAVLAEVYQEGQTVPALSYKAKLQDNRGETPSADMMVRFEIPVGVSGQSWNSAANPVETFVGQTLTIVNKDKVTHQLHTNGAPFPHSPGISAGSSYIMKIQAEYLASSNTVYDHDVGTTAPFFINAYDGKKLYESQCRSCHESGSAPRLPAGFATVPRIRSSINLRGSAMANMSSLRSLSTRQLEAISHYLGAFGN